jgi:toxin ParE1/3/4
MTVSYTRRAEQDLIEIGHYTVATWGAAQWAQYAALLEHTCEVILPKNYRFARNFPPRAGLLRWKCERHVIFFRKVRGGLEIVRVLHERMLPERHL